MTQTRGYYSGFTLTFLNILNGNNTSVFRIITAFFLSERSLFLSERSLPQSYKILQVGALVTAASVALSQLIKIVNAGYFDSPCA